MFDTVEKIVGVVSAVPQGELLGDIADQNETGCRDHPGDPWE